MSGRTYASSSAPLIIYFLGSRARRPDPLRLPTCRSLLLLLPPHPGATWPPMRWRTRILYCRMNNCFATLELAVGPSCKIVITVPPVVRLINFICSKIISHVFLFTDSFLKLTCHWVHTFTIFYFFISKIAKFSTERHCLSTIACHSIL